MDPRSVPAVYRQEPVAGASFVMQSPRVGNGQVRLSGGVGAVGGQVFREVALQLANELVSQLSDEHTREVAAMHQENLMLRGELQRVMELMQGYVVRERQLHDLLDSLNSTYSQATAQLHATHHHFAEQAKSTTGHSDAQRRALSDPLNDTVQELNRIQHILASPTVAPPDVPLHLHSVSQVSVSPVVLPATRSVVASPRPPTWQEPVTPTRTPTPSRIPGTYRPAPMHPSPLPHQTIV